MEPQLKQEIKVTLYLQPWQKRMIRDFTDLKKIDQISKAIIQPWKTGCPTSYKVLADFMKPGDWWIYLTDEQMHQLKEELHLETPVAVLNVTHEGLKSGAVAFA